MVSLDPSELTGRDDQYFNTMGPEQNSRYYADKDNFGWSFTEFVGKHMNDIN